MKARFEDMERNPLGSKDTDVMELGRFLIHGADLGNACCSTENYKRWS